MATSLESLVAGLERLDAQFHELREGVHRAIRLADQDPDMALTLARKVMEMAIHEVFERRIGPAGTRPLENLIQQLVKDGHLPTLIEGYATSVRKFGNVGAHGFGEKIKVDKTDAFQALASLGRVLEWYFEAERGIAFAPITAARSEPDLGELNASPRDAALRLPEHTFLRSLMPNVFELRHEPTGRVRLAWFLRASTEQVDAARRRHHLLARLANPGILPVHDVLTAADGMFVLEEAPPAPSLLEQLRGPPPMRGYVATFAAIAETLACAHEVGVVHGDLVPDEIFVADDCPVLRFPLISLPSINRTPAYEAPERLEWRSAEIDGRSDLYSLGVMLFEAVTGRRPFVARTVNEHISRLLSGASMPSPRQFVPSTSKIVEEVCARCLAHLPRDRYATARDVAARLREIREGPEHVGRWKRLFGKQRRT